MCRNLPDSLRWVNIRSIRYKGSSTSSQNQIPSSSQKSYGVAVKDVVSDRQPPNRTPSASPSATIWGGSKFQLRGASPPSRSQHQRSMSGERPLKKSRLSIGP